MTRELKAGRSFEEGESVLLLVPDGHSKLKASYSGPFTIEKEISPVTYQIAIPGRRKSETVQPCESVEELDHTDCYSISSVDYSNHTRFVVEMPDQLGHQSTGYLMH